ncbi:hypothetical protein CHUAL_000100 [Chamberlinius hualienensis]
MAETVDLIRDYCKEFILRPINEKIRKNEFYFNENMEKMEKYFLERIQQLENLTENNKHKTIELDKTIENLQVNQNKFEGKCELLREMDEKKFKEIELRLNEIKPSNEIKTEVIGQLQLEMKNKFEETVKTLDEEAKRLKKIENDTKIEMAQLQSKIETTSKAIEGLKSDEIGQLQTDINVIEELVKKINLNKELDQLEQLGKI